VGTIGLTVSDRSPRQQKRLSISQAIIDGEVIVATPEGLSDFAALQAELAAERSDRLTFYAFDLLYADRYDLRRAALVDRKAALQRLLVPAGRGRFLYADHLELGGATVFGRACEMGLEGVVSKLRDGPYPSGRSDAWRKSLCRQSALTKPVKKPKATWVRPDVLGRRRVSRRHAGWATSACVV